MPRIPPVTTAGLDDSNRRRRHREVTDLMLNFQHDDSRIRTPAEISAGVTPVNYAYAPINVKRYGAIGDGTTDDAAAIQRAIEVCVAQGGGDVIFPPGDYVITSSLDMRGHRAIRLIGEGAPPTGGAGVPSTLTLTTTSGSRLIDCRDSAGIVFQDLMILQTGAGYAAPVIDFEGATLDTFFGELRRCYIQGVSTATSLVNLHKTHSMNFDGNNMVGGICAIRGGGADYANRINVANNHFASQVTAPIIDPGVGSQVWWVVGNTFEPLSGGGAGAIFASGRVTNLVFLANWLGDANTTGSWIKVAAMDGSVINGNLISTGAKGVEFTGASSNNANDISANAFSAMTTALDISAATAWVGEYVNNLFLTVTNVIVGTPSGGRYEFGGTSFHQDVTILNGASPHGIGNTTSGVLWSILANGNIGQIIKAGSSQSVDLFQVLDNSGTAILAVTATGGLEMLEQSDPPAPGTNRGKVYVRDNGAGKSQLCVRFNSGAVQVIATEP